VPGERGYDYYPLPPPPIATTTAATAATKTVKQQRNLSQKIVQLGDVPQRVRFALQQSMVVLGVHFSFLLSHLKKKKKKWEGVAGRRTASQGRATSRRR
jgi:hypothetical protein